MDNLLKILDVVVRTALLEHVVDIIVTKIVFEEGVVVGRRIVIIEALKAFVLDDHIILVVFLNRLAHDFWFRNMMSLLAFQQAFRLEFKTAFDAGQGKRLFKVVKFFPTFWALTFCTPLWLRHLRSPLEDLWNLLRLPRSGGAVKA